MTNEEAIRLLERIKDRINFEVTDAQKKMDALNMAIKTLSEQRMGHWIYIGNSEANGLKIMKCSECGKRTYGSSKYCPNCRAKMR